jgi:hypothetical protein
VAELNAKETAQELLARARQEMILAKNNQQPAGV